MAELDRIEIVQFLLIAGLLSFWYYQMYTRTRCDRFREDLFTIRDKLFDYMWQHDLPYDLPAYQLIRDSLNGMIRTARVARFGVLMPLLFMSLRRQYPSPVRQAIEEIQGSGIKQDFMQVYSEVGRRVLKYLFLEGSSWLVFKPIDICLRLSFVEKRRPQTKSRVETLRESLDHKFVALGKPHSTEARTLAEFAPVCSR